MQSVASDVCTIYVARHQHLMSLSSHDLFGHVPLPHTVHEYEAHLPLFPGRYDIANLAAKNSSELPLNHHTQPRPYFLPSTSCRARSPSSLNSPLKNPGLSQSRLSPRPQPRPAASSAKGNPPWRFFLLLADLHRAVRPSRERLAAGESPA